MTKTADILDALGRDVVRESLGLTPSSLTDATREGALFPARWYGPMKKLADEKGIALPMGLFHWRSHGRKETDRSTSGEVA